MAGHPGKRLSALIAILPLLLPAPFRGAECGPLLPSPVTECESTMNRIAEKYVKLVLATGRHDEMYVDAYYGPESWREEAARDSLAVKTIEKEAAALLSELGGLEIPDGVEILALRRAFLAGQLGALHAYLRMLGGERLSFDAEAKALYDVEIPSFDDNLFVETRERIESLLPPSGDPLPERLEAFRKDFIIPGEKLEAVFATVIEEARARTKRFLDLPEGESFDIEYVTGTSWGAYNWYKGNGRSLIQVNTDLPTYIDSPLGLACHEGYPGHHVYNILLEENLSKKRGWVEFTVYPLFSPQSLLAEGTANYGIELLFPGGERLAYEREVLYPLAGIDPERAQLYSEIQELAKRLGQARIEAARRYLDGKASAEQTAAYLSAYALLSPDRARKLVSFFDGFRSYIINYYVGYDLVKAHIEGKYPGAEERPGRWKEFGEILSTPRVPSDLE